MPRLLKETDEAGWTRRASDPTDKRTVLVHLTRDGSTCLKTYYWDYLEAIAAELRPEDHPEYDIMITAIDQAIEIIQRVTDTINDS